MAIQRNLKAFVRYDGSGRVVAGSLILRKNKPKVGRWQEIPAYECCNYVPTSTTTTTTTASPTTTTTSTSTSTSTTTTTTTAEPTTTTTTTTAEPTTTTTTTTAEPTTTTTTTTAEPTCFCYTVDNQTERPLDYTYTDCGSEVPTSTSIEADTISIVCSSTAVTGDDGLIITGGTLSCNNSEGCPVEPTTTTTTTTVAPTTTTTTTVEPTTTTTTTTAEPTTTTTSTSTSTSTTTTTEAPTTTTTTTTTPPEPSAFTGNGTEEACAGGPPTVFYSVGPFGEGGTPQNGTVLYTDSGLTTPVTSPFVYLFMTGTVFNCTVGVLSNEGPCPEPTTTTTTTSTSTTTTTTTAVPVCFSYEAINNNPEAVTISWTNCDGSPGSQSVDPSGGSYSILCARENSVVTGGGFNVNTIASCEGPFYYEVEAYQTCGGSVTYGPSIVLSTVPVIVGKWYTIPPVIYPFPLYMNVLSTAVPTEGASNFSPFFTNPRDTCEESTTTTTTTAAPTTTTTTTVAPTTTTTTTTAPPSYYSYDVSNVFGGSGPGDACLAVQTIVLYANTNDPLGSLVGNFFYTDTALTTKFTGNPPGAGGYYRYGLTGDPITYRSDFIGNGTIMNVIQC